MRSATLQDKISICANKLYFYAMNEQFENKIMKNITFKVASNLFKDALPGVA